MTQPIDVAYVEVRADTKEFKTGLKKDIDKELGQTEKEVEKTSKSIGATLKETGEKVTGVFANLNEGLGISNFSLLHDMGLLDDATSGISTAGNAAKSSLEQVASLLGGMTGIIGELAATGPVGIAILAAAFVALAAAITVVAALLQSLIDIASAGLALLPTLALSAVAAFGVFAVAISGVSEAFKEQTAQSKAAGAAGVNSARQIADAQRGVLQAQKDVIKAREDELKRIREIQTALFRSKVTEARAIDNVKNAELALRDARALNSPRAVKEAELQLDEAKASLLEAKDRTKDLAAEKAKADKNGVEGSEQVQRALEQLRDAQDRLASAQSSGAAALAKQNSAFSGLTKSAQGFVTALVKAQEILGPVKDAIQEAFFKGTGPLIDPIAKNIKDLQPELVSVADGFNAIFTEILKFLGSKDARQIFSAILTGLSDFLHAIAPAVGPLLEAFGGLAKDGSSFGKVLGDLVAGGLLKLADFVKNVDIKKVFADGKAAIKELLPPIISIIKNVWDLFKVLVAIGKPILKLLLWQPQILQSVKNTFVKIKNFVVEFADALRNDPKKALEMLKNGLKAALDFVAQKFDDVLVFVSDKVNGLFAFIRDIPGKVSALGPKLFTVGKNIIELFFKGLAAVGGLAEDFSKKIANSLIRFLNRSVISGLNSGLKLVVDNLNKLPFFNLSAPNIPDIPQLAKGGLTGNPTIAALSETGKKEAVLPLESPRAMRAVGQAIASEGGTVPSQRGFGMAGTGGNIVQVFLGDDQLVPHTVRVVNRVDQRTARTIAQKPRRI